MQHMWSPWRSRHLDSFKQGTPAGRDGRSLFTRLLSEDQDEKNLILWRGREVFVIMNLYPYNNGHLMVVPCREVERYEDLTTTEMMEIGATVERCIRWLRHALSPEGFNVGINIGPASGAGVPTHLHVHVVPRWGGDTNFMPTIADVKVVPEAITDTYRKLRLAISELGDTFRALPAP